MDDSTNIKKILLIRPRCHGGDTAMPTGLMSVAAYLRQYGYSVVLRDLNHQAADFGDDVAAGVYGIVGISMLSFNRRHPYKLIRDIRKLNSGVKIVVGGIHGTSVPDLLVEHLPVDASVMGEGELPMKTLADYWLLGEGDIGQIPGVYTLEHGGIKGQAPVIEDLDTLPPIDYGDVDLDWYHSGMVRNRPHEVINGVHFAEAKYANLSFSRGCMGRCSFCNAFVHWQGQVRYRSAESLFYEIERLYRMGRNLFYFNDDAFGQDRQITLDLCQAIYYCGMKIAWFADARVDCFDDELLEWCAKSGCFALSFGIESGSQTILNNIRKGIRVKQIIRTVAAAKRAGIKAYALLMIGNEGETDFTIDETYELMKAIRPDIYSSLRAVLVFPSTRYELLMMRHRGFKREYWINSEDGAPTYMIGFDDKDLDRWNTKIRTLPMYW